MNYVTVPKYLWDYTFERALPDNSMAGGWIFLIILGSAIAYAVGIGICQALMNEDLDTNASGLVWPFVIPYLLGLFTVEIIRGWRAAARIPQARTLEKK